VFVWDLDAGRTVYAQRSAEPLVPASNLKLVTAAAALLHWGPDHRIRTELYGPDVPVYDGTLFGDLYLVGYGDPSLSTLAFQRRELHLKTASFEAFAKALSTRGVRRIEGRVLGDDSRFDRQRTVAGWKPGLEDECGRLSALSGNTGITAGKPVPQPAKFAALLLTRALRRAGIEVAGEPGAGTVPPTAALIKRQYSAPLRILLKRMGKDSDNFFAEVILKGLGRDVVGEGSTDAGAGVARATLAAVGLPAYSYVVHDGSGLSYENRISAEGLVRLLGALRQRRDFNDYYGSLAVAGSDGTLRLRMRGTAAAGNAHAKTGSLAVASCLSGYVKSANGRLVAYALLANGDPVDYWRTTRAEDAVVVALAKADLPGELRLRVNPRQRQLAESPIDPVHTVGRGLQPCVQP
jgi:D-alanyl-D-alanine carboxypeptidase/D-alanyl-D-alanine-endopeptidase (penicillin-binding protein 4)